MGLPELALLQTRPHQHILSLSVCLPAADKLAAAAAKLNCGQVTYSWESEDAFQVELRARPEQPTFDIPAWRMRKFAQQATWASQEHGHPGKVSVHGGVCVDVCGCVGVSICICICNCICAHENEAQGHWACVVHECILSQC